MRIRPLGPYRQSLNRPQPCHMAAIVQHTPSKLALLFHFTLGRLPPPDRSCRQKPSYTVHSAVYVGRPPLTKLGLRCLNRNDRFPVANKALTRSVGGHQPPANYQPFLDCPCISQEDARVSKNSYTSGHPWLSLNELCSAACLRALKSLSLNETSGLE